MNGGDKNSFSEYIGRSLTWIIAAFVLAVTVSALVTGGGIAHRSTIRVFIPESPESPDAGQVAAFQRILSDATRRPVMVSRSAGPHAGAYDLMIQPAFEWLLAPDDEHGAPIFSLGATAGRNDEAVLVARREGGHAAMADLALGGIRFAHRRSLNGFWNQLEMLQQAGVQPPAHLDSLQFAGGSGGHDCERVMIALLSGRARFGACCASTLEEMEQGGLLSPDTLEIVAAAPALPVLLVIAKRHEAGYFHAQLDGALPESGAGDGPGRIALEALTPAVLGRLQAVERLIGRYRDQL